MGRVYPGTPAEARHRLLEGFVLRLARRPDAEAFALRGGMLVRQWLPEVGRTALDLDLVCGLPFDEGAVRARLVAVLAEEGVSDGVRFDPERVKVRGIWADTAAPGLRLTARGRVDGRAADLRVDVTFGLEPWPVPQRTLFRAERGEARVWACGPEAIVARKLQVLANLGERRWRPKDLNDVGMVLGRFELDRRVLGEAIEAALTGCGESVGDLRDVVAARWWDEPGAGSRWSAFLARAGGAAPGDLGGRVASVRAGLRPVLGGAT